MSEDERASGHQGRAKASGGEWTPTFCRLCEACCGLEARVVDGEVTALRPDAAHVASRGYACAKGLRAHELHASSDRLLTPRMRIAGRLEEVSWERALSALAQRLLAIRAKHGARSIAAYIGNPPAFNLPHGVFLHGLIRGLGSTSVYSAGSQDCNNKFAVAQRMYGAPTLQPLPDVDRAGCVILVGTNPAVSHASLVSLPRPIERLRGVEARGGQVFVVDPRRTETARAVGEHVPVSPGTDVLWLASFVREILRRRPPSGRIRKHLRGVDELREVVEDFSPERTAPATGISPERLNTMLDAYLGAGDRGQGACLYASTGLNLGGHGTLAYWLLSAANAVSGNLDREGGVVAPKGLVDLPRLMHRSGLGMRQGRSRVGGYPLVMDTLPAGVLADEMLTPGEGQLRALLVSAGNPLLSCPHEARLREGLSQLSLLVSVDLFINETAELADFVLPATSFFERADLPVAAMGFAVKPWVQLAKPLSPARGGAREEAWIYRELARHVGLPLFGSRAASFALDLLARGTDLPGVSTTFGEALMHGVLTAGGVTPPRLGRHPHGLRLDRVRAGDLLGKRILTEDGLVDVAPADLARAAPRVLTLALTEYTTRDEGLRLVGRRLKLSHNSWAHSAPGLARGRQGRCVMTMHPVDAEARGLVSGDHARVTTSSASIELPIVLSDEVMRGVVVIPHGFGHEEATHLTTARGALGPNVNRLAASGPGTLEAFAGMSRLTATEVQVERLPPG